MLVIEKIKKKLKIVWNFVCAILQEFNRGFQWLKSTYCRKNNFIFGWKKCLSYKFQKWKMYDMHFLKKWKFIEIFVCEILHEFKRGFQRLKSFYFKKINSVSVAKNAYHINFQIWKLYDMLFFIEKRQISGKKIFNHSLSAQIYILQKTNLKSILTFCV